MPASVLTNLNPTPPPPEFTAEEVDLLLQNLDTYTPEEPQVQEQETEEEASEDLPF